MSLIHKTYLNIIGAFLVLPIFFVLSGAGITLPETYYEVQGIPLHANFLTLTLFPFFYIARIKFILTFLLCSIYIIIGALEGGDRSLLFLQQLHFFIVYLCLENLSPSSLNHVVKGFLFSLKALVFTHVLSIFFSLSSGNIITSGPFIFDVVIYQ